MSLCPSVFDVVASGILATVFIQNRFYKGTFFIFYSIFIMTFSILLKPRRRFTSIPLWLFLAWALAMVFTHNEIKIVEGSVMNYYFNVAIMFEGFIYIFCGVMLLKTIIEHSKCMKYVYLMLPAILIPFIRTYSYGGRITPIVALVVSFIIYLILKKDFVVASIVGLAGASVALIKWPWVAMKFACRPYVMVELIKQMFEHPVKGSGFKSLLGAENMIWVRQIGDVVYGWIYRHNDFLSIGAYLGVFALICITLFVFESMFRIGITPYLIPFMAIILTCFFQMTMFEPDKAALCIVLGAISLKESHKGDWR